MTEIENRMVIDSEWDEYDYGYSRKRDEEEELPDWLLDEEEE